jgi:hypothetical protein
MHLWWEPVDDESNSKVVVKIFESESEISELNDIWQKFSQLRQVARHWGQVYYLKGLMDDVFALNASTVTAYKWIEDDLRRIKWME